MMGTRKLGGVQGGYFAFRRTVRQQGKTRIRIEKRSKEPQTERERYKHQYVRGEKEYRGTGIWLGERQRSL